MCGIDVQICFAYADEVRKNYSQYMRESLPGYEIFFRGYFLFYNTGYHVRLDDLDSTQKRG